MNEKKILKQLKRKLNAETTFLSCLGADNVRTTLVMGHRCGYCSCLVFGIRNDMLEIIREYHYDGCLHISENYVLVMGEINVDTIIEAMNIFEKYGRKNNKNNPTMKELLENNRFAKTKSARNI